MRFVHGQSAGSKSPEYRSWTNMRNRCQNPLNANFPRYGGRGITVCQRWDSFEVFLQDMGPKPSLKHSIDRMDNNKSYEPANCRWATRAQQMRNTRRNCNLTWNGITLCLPEWAERLGLPKETLVSRIKAGWTAAEAIETPVRVGEKFSHNGLSLSVSGWAKKLGLPAQMLRDRIKRGWSITDALTKPVRNNGPSRS